MLLHLNLAAPGSCIKLSPKMFILGPTSLASTCSNRLTHTLQGSAGLEVCLGGRLASDTKLAGRDMNKTNAFGTDAVPPNVRPAYTSRRPFADSGCLKTSDAARVNPRCPSRLS